MQKYPLVIFNLLLSHSYQAESQPLRPCELQREKAFQGGEDYIPQCSEDGQFRNIQCDKNGVTCWCVDDKGAEVVGTRRAGSPVACLSFCQLQKQRILVSRYVNSSTTPYVPACLDSGDFDPMQCDLGQEQCWCVDSEGMEIYGTRQKGKLKRCPGKCEIRDRRLLHGVGEKSPPQCSADGEFLPVQCKFVNRTDRMVFDLIRNFNRFPEAFLTFSTFRSLFPEVSGYCYCADSLGRELDDTGLEMLLENVYDTVFASLEPVSTFTETSMYRILQRRFLGVQLATFGRFRCPSKCETERFTALQFKHIYWPSCDENGAYEPKQCQLDGECWCVDAKGQELPGTRRRGQAPACGEEHTCISVRQVALSRLFYGPVGHFSQQNLFSATQEPQRTAGSSCPPWFKELFVDSGVLSPITKRMSVSQLPALESILSEAIRGMFPSRELARIALQFTSNPRRFQENLFGGKFLKNLVEFNVTGALGPNGKFNLDRFFQQRGMAIGFSELGQQLSPLVPQEKFNLSQVVADRLGRTVNLQDNQNAVLFLTSLLEAPEFFPFLTHVISVPETVAEDLGDVARIVLKSKDCVEQAETLFVPACTKEGRYEEIQCYAGDCWCVNLSGREIPGTRVRGVRPRCPTACEKQRESLQRLQRSQPAGSELFVPSCTQEGKFLPVQCHGRDCFCVDSEGRRIPGIDANSGWPLQCPRDCQLAAGQAVLRTVQQLLLDPAAFAQLANVYIPQCSLDGQWKQVQCNGPPEQAFEWYQRWITQNNNGRDLSLIDLVGVLNDYEKRSQQNFEDFVKNLYETGQQNIFPELSKYPFFDIVPPEVLEGKTTQRSPANILLEPFTFWQLLHGNLIHYPGSYSGFSSPLGHFDLRNCWCVDEKGQMQGTHSMTLFLPVGPGECEAAKREAREFANQVELLIRDSSTSHFPFGESFLMAKVAMLTEDELLNNFSQPGILFSEKLLTGKDYALRLAAQSTLHFYWRRHFTSQASAGEAVRLGFQPYLPQCDGLGNWEPVQCYESSGHCWCVDERGRYIADSLVTRSTNRPQCKSPSSSQVFLCPFRAQSSLGELFIKLGLSQSSGTLSSFCPGYCTVLKAKVLLREIGRGHVPQCENDTGNFSPVQCSEDQGSCWCVFEDGEEAPGTQVHGRMPRCQRESFCRLPFETPEITNGGAFCDVSPETPKVQQCRVICRPGFQDVSSSGKMLLCDVEARLWLGDTPHAHTCQSLQPFQSVQTQAQFQLLLPPGKACSPDYSGLLEAFQVFILDEMKARGFCHIQVNNFGRLVSVPLCGDSAILVECLTADRLGVNITWRMLLEDLPAASLPDLNNIEKAMVGENLIGRFELMIKSHGFVLLLDNKQFPADASIRFIGNGDFASSPQAHLGCKKGFQKVLNAGGVAPNSQGCVVCPPGTSFQNESCIPCPSGFYQDQAGSLLCIQCPLGKSTVSTGAFRAEHCVTDCQMQSQGVRCDASGQYRPAYEDPATEKSFCVDRLGEILDWTETEGPLTDSQCSGQWTRQCEEDESCGFLTLSAVGTGTLCELYSAREANYNCSASGRSLSSNKHQFTRQYCFLEHHVFSLSFPGQEFTTAGVKTFEMTDFQDVVSGVYSNLVFSAAGTSLTDVHLFCRQACSQDACCDGFILSQIILDGGNILCGLMSYPDALICHIKDWDGSSTREEDGTCQKMKYDEQKKQSVFRLGGQVLTGPSEFPGKTGNTFTSFQRVYLWRVNKQRLTSSFCLLASGCSASAMELFSLMESSQIQIDQNRSLPSQEYWLLKPRYSAEQARLWCLARCAEDEFCQLAGVPRDTTTVFFPCTLYPAAQACGSIIKGIPENCSVVLPRKPEFLYQKRVSLEGSVKNFYTRLPFRKMSSISVRSKMDVSGKTVSNGFFDCERFCDADPCCSGFGLLNASQGAGGKVLCLILDSLGVQTCSQELRNNDWQVSDCTSLEGEVMAHPFGWYQKPKFCEMTSTLGKWQRMDRTSVLIDPSISTFDVMHVSKDASSDFATIQNFCLSVCSKNKLCMVTTLEVQPTVIRCIFYPETQSCRLGLQSHLCRLLLKEPATFIFRKKALYKLSYSAGSHSPQSYKQSCFIQVDSNWKGIRQFLGVPYAAPPVVEKRFHPPQPFTEEASWNATAARAGCWQPGDEVSPFVSEDCLYLNIFVPLNSGGNLPVLVFFHNGVNDKNQLKRTVLDGSYLAGVGNIIVLTANYRVGVFGFLSTGSSTASGNWGLLDQEAVLQWVQKNIESFGGDPSQISIAADRNGADIASIHLFSRALESALFKRALLMGGSAFSPVSAISPEKASAQAAVLAQELGCPSASSEEIVSCLRQLPAKALNDAQTRLLAISGPFQYWSPVVDGSYLQDSLTAALQRPRPLEVDLLLGSAQQDGLISRAKAIKRFEESQGRANSKTAFYQALQNSLGGEDANPAILEAATWFYSLQHSSSEYASFSKALENATRDRFIICPTVDMARHWAGNGRGNVFMYHVPDSSSLSSLELLPDVQYAFGLPFYPQYENQYTLEEKALSLAVMQYLANFIKSGNPNSPYRFSRKVTGVTVPWPLFRADTDGDNYKEFTASLENHKGLKKAECLFWSDYIKTLQASTNCKCQDYLHICIIVHAFYSLWADVHEHGAFSTFNA
uniref:Thyroglobulin n=1 Tax=Varanus komodoensis TaxID=61221 RepID=A0A8D2KSV9_VARKO